MISRELSESDEREYERRMAPIEKLLLKVQRPGRYVGGEFNSIIKKPDSSTTRVALAFPDIYDLGVPNLGLAIFYDLLNRDPSIWAERTFSPWEDMEAEMRAANISLFTLESKTPVSQMDILAITIPYESLYTNVLNLIDLAGLPVYAAERSSDHPLIIAGGHATFNPEPMSPFIDAFVIGEGEEIFPKMIRVYQEWKKFRQSRQELLVALSKLKGVYIPSFYEVFYKSDGTIDRIQPKDPSYPAKVQKVIVPILPPPPKTYIVPSIDVIQNRVALEIMRGCTRGCRFCQAGYVTRPVRERSVDEIMQAIQSALDSTGYEEIALLSLSSSDYRQIQELVNRLSEEYRQRKLNVSLPSLRIESVSVDILEKLQGSRFSGFTLAPEAASEKIKATINKPISEDQLMETVETIYSHGWHSIKLYFMIGLPGETMEDVEAICDLCLKVIKVGRRLIGKRSQLNVGIATFVPKPHTAFQWCKVDNEQNIREKQSLLRKRLFIPGVKVNWNNADVTMFEAWSSRGDRRMAAVIHRAWQLGAKFDAWQDHFDWQKWMQAFEENGLTPDFYIARKRGKDEILPWDHIDIGVRKSTLRAEFERSESGILREDCRGKCYGCGINYAFRTIQPKDGEKRWYCPVIEVNTDPGEADL